MNTIPLCGFCKKPIIGASSIYGFHLECTKSPSWQTMLTEERVREIVIEEINKSIVLKI